MDVDTNLEVLKLLASTIAEYALMDDKPGIPHDETFVLLMRPAKGEHNTLAGHVIWQQEREVLKPYPHGILVRTERRTFSSRGPGGPHGGLGDAPPAEDDEAWHGWVENSPGVVMPWEQLFPMLALVAGSLRRAMDGEAEEDPLHPNGRCTCGCEGTCEWCRQYRTKENGY